MYRPPKSRRKILNGHNSILDYVQKRGSFQAGVLDFGAPVVVESRFRAFHESQQASRIHKPHAVAQAAGAGA
jgi:hypothetical protein